MVNKDLHTIVFKPTIFIARQHTRDIDIANLSVRPSVRLSVCPLRSGIG